nr:MAG TPA: hypothetical protein [Caudoviricetes sp.]
MSDILTKDIDTFKKGVISSFAPIRTPDEALHEGTNIILIDNGIVRPRGSFLSADIPDIPDDFKMVDGPTGKEYIYAERHSIGQEYVFKREDGSEGLINLFTSEFYPEVATIITLERNKKTWKIHDEKLKNTGIASFAQIGGKVMIATGDDRTTYFDIEKNEIIKLSPISDPFTAPKATKQNFSGDGVNDYYYAVVFNGIAGSTKLSPSVKMGNLALRESWQGKKSITIDITDIKVNGDVKSWGVYITSVPKGAGGVVDSEFFKIADGLDMNQKTWVDNGNTPLSLTKAPVENTTGGIIANYYVNLSGKLWAIDANHSRVYWGGDSDHAIYFGTDHGAGDYKIDERGIERPAAITVGRDNAGTSCINILTSTVAGQGGIWDVYGVTNSITANGQTFSVGTYQFKRREGNDGTDAPGSVIRENNNVYYLSTSGFKSTGVKPNISGIQSTDIISSAINDRVLNLSRNNIHKCSAVSYDQCLFWSVAYGSNKNNEIWVYDILHGGVWTVWQYRNDCMFRWASNDSEAPSLYARIGKKLYKYYKNSYMHQDGGTPFKAVVKTGLIGLTSDKIFWAHLLKIIWQFNNYLGTINITVNLHTKNGDISKKKQLTINNNNNNNNNNTWNSTTYEHFGYNNFSWNDINNKSCVQVLADMIKISQKIRKNFNYISFAIETDTAGTSYELSCATLLYVPIGIGMEFLSQKDIIKI